MTAHYVLTSDAEADLRGIVRYTRGQWGDRQARAYLAKLQRGIERTAIGEGPVRNLSEIHPHLKVARCEHHFVFCLPRKSQPTLVVAVLHERMDLLTRLSERLMPPEA